MPRSSLSAWTLPERPLSHQAWVDQRCRALLRRAEAPITAALESCGLRAVYLGGSASTGEAMGRLSPGALVLSDLDLAVIVDRWPSAETRRQVQQSADASPDRGDPHLTIGFYPTAALHRQQPTLGWCDLVAIDARLWVRPAAFLPISAPEASHIPAYEGFRLLGNRALELWRAAAALEGRPADPIAGAMFTHALAKAMIANWTAWLVFRGEYQAGQQVRLRRLDASSAPPQVVDAAREFEPYFADPDRYSLADGALDRYRLALRRILEESPELPCERVVLRDRLGFRDLWRAWRDHLQGAERRIPGAWRIVRSCLRTGDPMATPELRRLALALGYWAGADDVEWAAHAVRWLGQPLPREAAAAERLLDLP